MNAVSPDFIDLHCHILPGIDDGCQSLDQSLNCIRQWIAAGVRGAVCTPHVCTSWYPDNCPHAIANWVRELKSQLDRAGIEFALWPGGELRLAPRTIAWLEEFGVPTLGAGKAVLIDWWGCDWPSCCGEAIEYLLEKGYQPILAHPERMGLEPDELDEVLNRLQERGVLLQGNLNSIAGGEGPFAQMLADRLLSEGRYFLLASDTHGPDSVPGRVAGLARVRQQCGDEVLSTLFSARPREVMQWGL